VGQVKLIFASTSLFSDKQTQDQTPSSKVLAYVNWFKYSTKDPDPDFQFYRVEHAFNTNRERSGSVVELESIVQPCPLLPRFPKEAKDLGENVNGDNCLEMVNRFWINSFHDQATYQTVF
jgi:hypothetical protein